MTRPPHTLVTGIGSHSGDDQIGWYVADLVRGALQRRIEVGRLSDAKLARASAVDVRNVAVPLDVIDLLDDVDSLHMIDACEATSSDCSIRRLDWRSEQAAAGGGIPDATPQPRSSHGFDVVSTLRLAQQTGRLPRQVTIWAITGSCFTPGAALSASVCSNGFVAATEIVNELCSTRDTTMTQGS